MSITRSIIMLHKGFYFKNITLILGHGLYVSMTIQILGGLHDYLTPNLKPFGI